MNAEPSLYRRANKLQRHDAKEIILEFADVFRLRSDGRDSLMDVGCGTGDVLMDFILPILPRTYSRVVGTDISPSMVEYSKKGYADYDRVDFKVLDIETDKMPLEYYEQFDHVTSFFCLHWIQNQRQALRNIHNMLYKGGDCLLVFVGSTPGFDAFPVLAANPKWSDYMKDFEKFVPPFQNVSDPWLTYITLLREEGFVDCHVEIRNKSFIYEGYDCLRNHVLSVTPFIGRIPDDIRDEYENEMVEYWKGICLMEKMSHKDDHRYICPYTIVVACAKK